MERICDCPAEGKEICKPTRSTEDVSIGGIKVPVRASREIPESRLQNFEEAWDQAFYSRLVDGVGTSYERSLGELCDLIANNPEVIHVITGQKQIVEG